MALPQHMHPDDPAAAEPARRRLLQKSPFPRLPTFPSLRSPNTAPLPLLPSDGPTDDIFIHDVHPPPLPNSQAIFRWAVLYENQRGITLFSTPFYSPLSLLPSDPPPFTAPNPSNPRQHLPNLSLDNYPLPDGTWRWVSTAWMIDMRSELGEVQHDGFEYNWLFRDNHWHASVGRLGAGAWVRRRRWIRLMMCPAIHAHTHNSTLPFSPPHSILSPASRSSLAQLDHYVYHEWDGSDRDWQHVRLLLKHLGRDGRKLELWQMWLTQMDIKGKCKQSDMPSQKALISDIIPNENSPPPVHLITLLRNHGEAILRSFVFPDSRAQFVRLVHQAGLAPDLEHCLGRTFSVADVDFWSYADNLSKD